MPALGMAQETGKILRWLKAEGDVLRAGEPVMEIETDKAVLEIEAPASGTLANVNAREGEEGMTTRSPGMCANRASRLSECCAAEERSVPSEGSPFLPPPRICRRSHHPPGSL